MMRGGTATWGLSLLLWLCAVEALGADAPSRRPLAPDDIYRVQTLSDPQVSPDGGWVAYVVTSNDRDADEQRSAVWMVSWDGRQQLALTAAGKKTSKPRWSPDGRYLAFLATPPGSDEAQIMLLDRRGGDARPLTSVAGDISEYAWSPNGRRIVLAMEQGGSTGKVPRPIVIEAMHFKSDEEGYFGTGQAHHLYLVDVDGQRLETLTSDSSYTEDRPIFSPDGKHILFTRTRDRGGDQDGMFDLEVMDAEPGANARRLAHAFAPNSQRLAVSPDGTTIAYLEGLAPKFNAYMQDHLAVVPASGGASRDLSEKLDRAVSSFVFTGAK
ncbi:MAG: S9 family peptidase, partial [Pseudomonadota bacterium]|nr:S9 family peptidase [Pseudomonadota bacterium]